MAKKKEKKAKAPSDSDMGKSESQLANDHAQANQIISQLREEIVGLRNDYAAISIASVNVTYLDPQVMASCIGVLRDRINGYPLEDNEFKLIAPKFVDQACELTYMLQEASADFSRRMAAPDEDNDDDGDAPQVRKGGPVLA